MCRGDGDQVYLSVMTGLVDGRYRRTLLQESTLADRHAYRHIRPFYSSASSLIPDVPVAADS